MDQHADIKKLVQHKDSSRMDKCEEKLTNKLINSGFICE